MELDFQRRLELNSSLQINAEIVHFLLRHLQIENGKSCARIKTKGTGAIRRASTRWRFVQLPHVL